MTVLDEIIDRANEVMEQHEKMRWTGPQFRHDWRGMEAMPHRHEDVDGTETKA